MTAASGMLFYGSRSKIAPSGLSRHEAGTIAFLTTQVSTFADLLRCTAGPVSARLRPTSGWWLWRRRMRLARAALHGPRPRTTAPGCATRLPSTSRAGRPSRDRRFPLHHDNNPEPLGSTPSQDSPTTRLAIRAGRGDPRARAPTSGQQVCGRARSTSRARVEHRMERSRSSVCSL